MKMSISSSTGSTQIIKFSDSFLEDSESSPKSLFTLKILAESVIIGSVFVWLVSVCVTI